MACSKLLLPSSAALFQPSPIQPTLCDRHRHLLVPSSFNRLSQQSQQLVPRTSLLEPTITVRVSRDSAESLSFGDERSSSSEDEDESVTQNGRASTVDGTAKDIEGALSKYVWSRPRKDTFQLSRKDREALVDSLASTELNLLQNLDRARFKLSPSDFGNLLKRLIREQKWDKVGLVFDWMKVNKKLRAPSFSSYITMMGKAGFRDKALRAYKGLTNFDLKVNTFVCNALLKVLVDAGSIEKALTMFEEMKSDGFLPDLYTYSTLITGCAKRQNGYHKAKSYMDEMSSKGLKPDAFIYSSMLHVCARAGLEDEAKALFEEMHTKGLKPAIFHYAPLLNMYAEKKKPEEAEKVFDEFKKTGIKVNEVIINSLIKAYLNTGQLEKASHIFAEMPSICGPPGVISYSVMMDAYCKAGQIERAQSLFDELKEKKMVPGNFAYSILISAYSKLGRADMVLALSKELESGRQERLDPILCNSMLKSYCELGMMDAVMNVLKRMNEELISPDRATFNILICFFCKQKLFDLALHTLNNLKVRRLRPNLNSYAPLIIELSNAGRCDEALKLYPEMKEVGLPIQESVLCPLIDALCRENRLGEAFKIFKDLLDAGFSPLPNCTENILTLSGSNSEILEELLKDGFIPSDVLRQVNMAKVLRAYERQGCFSSMHKLLEFIAKEGLSLGDEDLGDDVVENLKECGQIELLSKLSGLMSKMDEASEVSLAL